VGVLGGAAAKSGWDTELEAFRLFYFFQIENVSIVVDNSSGLFSNLSATIAPTTSNDVSQGCVIGSLWVDTVADIAYTNVDNILGNAVWKAGTLSIDDASANLTTTWSSQKINTTKLNLSGGALSGNLNMAANKITSS
jgi:hypothetical protein